MSGRHSGTAVRALVMALLVAGCTVGPIAEGPASPVPTESIRPAQASDHVELPSPTAEAPSATPTASRLDAAAQWSAFKDWLPTVMPGLSMALGAVRDKDVMTDPVRAAEAPKELQQIARAMLQYLDAHPPADCYRSLQNDLHFTLERFDEAGEIDNYVFPNYLGADVPDDPMWGLNAFFRELGDDVIVCGPQPTPEPTPEPTPPPPLAYRPGPLRVDGFAEVLVTDLVVRAKPFVGTGSVILQLVPSPGDLLFVIAGPVEGSGYAWYQVAPSDWQGPVFYDGDPLIGWVAAASRAGEPWLAGRAPVCPTLPLELERLPRMTGLEKLACFGSRPITVDSDMGQWSDMFGPSYPWGTPDWLNGLVGFGTDAFLMGSEPGPPWARNVRFSLDSVTSESDPAMPGEYGDVGYRVTGHFDDPASRTCRGGMEDSEAAGEPVRTESPIEEQVLGCRTHFVVTKALGLHRVSAGETLSIIAQEHGATLDAFLAENPQIVDPNIVHVGDLIVIPPTPAP